MSLDVAPAAPVAVQAVVTDESEHAVDGTEGASDDKIAENWVPLEFTHAGKPYTLELADSDRVFDLKAALENLTTVPPDRQKIIGLVKGKLPPDQATIKELNLVPGKKFTLIGTPQGKEYKDPSEVDLPDVVNYLDIDFASNHEAAAKVQSDRRNLRKIREVVASTNVNIMNPLREGKSLLVLDLDYTILDTKPLTSGTLPPSMCARPHLHEFLEAAYLYYDICIWSQTSWIWLETKLAELGIVGHDRPYKIAFVLDKKSMFQVFTKQDGKDFQHHVKPLKVIWSLFPQYSAKNTIHIDDLSRNFALNPSEGLKISAFKDCHTTKAMQDRELISLSKYLTHIAASGVSFQTFEHKNWKRAVSRLRDVDAPGPSDSAS